MLSVATDTRRLEDGHCGYLIQGNFVTAVLSSARINRSPGGTPLTFSEG
jgi:hypothetical protein